MEELELTYLVRELPKGATNVPSKELLDIYIPKNADHALLRIRRSGEEYEITKKQPVGNDFSHQIETTIPLTVDEFTELSSLEGKRVEKVRYYYPENGISYEIDIFRGGLSGLILADVEFSSQAEKLQFQMPNWCLADVTQEEFIAGGILCGKSYEDIRSELERFGYRKFDTQDAS